MPRFSSQQLLQQLEEDVNNLRRTAKQEFSHLTDNQILQAPSLETWSIAQCLEHLNSYGHYYLPLMETVIKTGEEQNIAEKAIFKSSWLGNYFAKSMQPGTDGTIRLKMKAVKNHTPSIELDAQAVLAEFCRQQAQLEDMLKRAQKVDIGALRIPISIARWIRLSLGDTFRFLIAHEQRHVLQAQQVHKALFLKETQLKTFS